MQTLPGFDGGRPHFYDFAGTQGFMWMKAWRCMNCGHAVDAVGEANRRLREKKARDAKKGLWVDPADPAVELSQSTAGLADFS